MPVKVKKIEIGAIRSKINNFHLAYVSKTHQTSKIKHHKSNIPHPKPSPPGAYFHNACHKAQRS